MCKVLNIPKITDQTRSATMKFIAAMAPLMSQGNRDGIGYSAVSGDESLFGERWHNNDEFMKVRQNSEIDEALNNTFGEVITQLIGVGHKYNSFGDVQTGLSTMKAITLHTRYATSGKEFTNTHPFVYPEKDTSLIHNGVIRNVSSFNFKVSTCDSESILISYLNNGVNLDLSKVQAMDDSLNGYYVAALFSRDANGVRIMDIIKGPSASLAVFYIQELGGYVFSTSAEDVLKACATLGFKVSTGVGIREGSAMRFVNGELVSTVKFTALANAPMYIGSSYLGNAQTTTQTTATKTSGGTHGLVGITKFQNGKTTFIKQTRRA